MIFIYTWAMLAVGFFLGAAWSSLGRKNKELEGAFNDKFEGAYSDIGDIHSV